MSIIIDQRTGFTVANTDKNPLSPHTLIDDVRKSLNCTILSASGWRRVFSENGDEESFTEEISPADAALAAGMASVYADLIISKSGNSQPVVAIGMDSRPTGPVIADIFSRISLAKGIKLRPLFIVTAPEIMAWTGQSSDIDGFIYISASHNPVGHNGIKFGLNDGGVIGGQTAAALIQDLKDFWTVDSRIQELFDLTATITSDRLEQLYGEISDWKKQSEKAYFKFAKSIFCGSSAEKEQLDFLSILQDGLSQSPVSVLGELNGSARGLSIDSPLLEAIGVAYTGLNTTPRQIVHRIVPEGASLDLCKSELEKLYSSDSSYKMGYVPDNDGDRGNIVYVNEKSGKGAILEAQQVFALSVLSELAFLRWNGFTGKAAVAVNGPTSLRIRDIAAAFDADVFEAEVGEANVVNLAENLRQQGYNVPILGEGSNGGNITHPARVRDPLNTIGALVKLISLKSVSGRAGLYELWLQGSGQIDKYKADYTLDDIIETLPCWITTSAYEPEAIMKITTETHGELKQRFEKNFPTEWFDKEELLKKDFGFFSWEEYNNEGTESRQGIGSDFRNGAETGGLKILFKDDKGSPAGYLWMRGSGTEPVFRVLCDVKGNNPASEKLLIGWLRGMVNRADNPESGKNEWV